MNGTPNDRPQIVILSGGTGRTASQVLNAALAQFENLQVKIVHKATIRQVDEALQIVRQAADNGAVVCTTLVDPEVREAVNRQLLKLNVPHLDLLGPIISLLSDQLGVAPRGQPGLLYELCKEQFDRSDAVDYTFAHDDGQRVHDLDRADVVLVGVSRASKSVTCFYLAARGIRAANVPLTMLHDPPPELIRLDPHRVIGVTMNAARLRSLRQTRLDRLTSRQVDGYAQQRDIAAELRFANDIMHQHGWRVIDVSYKATEEAASQIIQMLAEVPEDQHSRN